MAYRFSAPLDAVPTVQILRRQCWPKAFINRRRQNLHCPLLHLLLDPSLRPPPEQPVDHRRVPVFSQLLQQQCHSQHWKQERPSLRVRTVAFTSKSLTLKKFGLGAGSSPNPMLGQEDGILRYRPVELALDRTGPGPNSEARGGDRC